MDEKDLPRVQETVLKKRKRNQEARAQQQKLNAIKAKGRRFAKKTFFKRAEKYTKENKKSQRHAVHVLREAKKPEKCVIKPRGDLAFVLRIRGDKDTPFKANQILSLLRLDYQERGVFLRLNRTTIALLQMVDPFITWGYPNLRTVKDLIFKRGHGSINKRNSKTRAPLTDNLYIEKVLGKYDIVCLEDLVHEIFTPDSANFKAANDFLHSFKLNAPVGGWKKKGKHFKDGGDFGCRHDQINALLKTLI